jgi:uncharacterized protein with ParB-like and HNH nuclease domain
MQLNPIHVTVFKLLEGRLFRIPGYQRSYSWGRHQRADLFRDIEEAQRSGRDHFMATVVGLSRETIGIGAEEFRVVELVDGQQRVGIDAEHADEALQFAGTFTREKAPNKVLT